MAVVASHLATRLKRQSEVDRLREALIGSVSHELRTPLASILGAASVIGQAPAVASDERLAPLATMIREEVERLNSDIQNLLDATRISSEGISPKLESVDPADLINGACERCERRLKSHVLEVDLPDELPFVVTDVLLVEQALTQTLDNAAKYSPAGGVIRITADIERDYVKINVTDHGAGLTSQERRRLKERFFRGSRHAVSRPGSGLGLWIADSFVSASGGSLDIQSDGVARGTTASISLPKTREDLQSMEGRADE